MQKRGYVVNTRANMSRKKQVTSPTFEESLAQLEEVVRALEVGKLSLNDSLSTYREGIDLLNRCNELLAEAEQTVALWRGVDAEGRAQLEKVDAADFRTNTDIAARGE